MILIYETFQESKRRQKLKSELNFRTSEITLRKFTWKMTDIKRRSNIIISSLYYAACIWTYCDYLHHREIAVEATRGVLDLELSHLFYTV